MRFSRNQVMVRSTTFFVLHSCDIPKPQADKINNLNKSTSPPVQITAIKPIPGLKFKSFIVQRSYILNKMSAECYVSNFYDVMSNVFVNE